MKKVAIMLLAGLAGLTSTSVYAESPLVQGDNGTTYPKINVKVEGACGEGICGEGYKINNTSYVPIRVVLESMGATVKWDEKSQTATVIRAQEPAEKKKEVDQAYISETTQLYEDFKVELELLTLLDQQFNLAYETYDKFNDTMRYDMISKGKIREHQKTVEEFTKRLTEYQGSYGNQNPDILKVMNVSSQINNIVTHYQLASDAFGKYISSKDMQQLKNFLMYRGFALDEVESAIADLNALKLILQEKDQ